MVDKAFLGQPNKHRPTVDPLLKVGWKIAFIDDLDLYSGYRVFPYVVGLGGLERKRERCQTSPAPDETQKHGLDLKPIAIPSSAECAQGKLPLLSPPTPEEKLSAAAGTSHVGWCKT